MRRLRQDLINLVSRLEGRRSIRLSYGRLIHSRGFPAPGTTHLYVNQPVRAESRSRHNSLSMRANPRDPLSEFDSRYLFLECLAGGVSSIAGCTRRWGSVL